MTHWLVYWKTYWDDVDDPSTLDPEWNSSYDQLYEHATLGDTIWVVVASRQSNESTWRLLERFNFASKEVTPDSPLGFRYRFNGDHSTHILYDPTQPADITGVLTTLRFETDNPIRLTGRRIAQALQSPRKLNHLDARKLEIHAQGLTQIPRRHHGAA